MSLPELPPLLKHTLALGGLSPPPPGRMEVPRNGHFHPRVVI